MRLLQDIRFAWRRLSREPGFATAAVVVLGLGLGVNNMMFTLIYGSTMRGLPIPDRDRVLHISAVDPRFPDRPLTHDEYEHLRDHARAFMGLAAFVSAPVAVSDPGRAADRFDATYLTANALGLIGTAPALGRGFTPDDDRPGAGAVAILGAQAWRLRYAEDPAVVGRTIVIDGVPTTVIGVMPEPSRFPTTAEIWLPLWRQPSFSTGTGATRTLRVFGRLSDGATEADARAEIEALFAAVVAADPARRDLRALVVPLNDRFFFPATQPAWLAFSAAGVLILLVTCANAANLMLSATVRRAREMAVRSALGASRARIVGQILVESLVIAAGGGVIAAGVSLVAVQIFSSAIPDGAMPYWLDYTMDARVLLALVVASFLAVLLVGLLPAMHASRTESRVLKDGGRSGTARSNRRLATAFLAAELAIAIVLATQFAQSWRGAPRVPSDAAVETAEVLTTAVTLPSGTYSGPDERHAFYQRLLDRVSGIGGVIAVSAASAVPLGGAVEQRLEVEHITPLEPDRAPRVATVAIGPRFFETIAVPLRRGRAFTAADGVSEDTAIVNQRFVDVHLPGVDPVGRRIRLTPTQAPTSAAWLAIVGIAEDIKQRPTAGIEPVVYTPIAAAVPAAASILLRSRFGPEEAATLLRQQVMAVDPSLPLYRVMTLAQSIEDAQWNGRVSQRLITALTLLAAIVSIVGLYAVTSHAVSQRTQELGIRIAVGASAADVRRLILGRAAFQAALGLLLGLAGSAAWTAAFFTGRAAPPLVQLDLFLPIVASLVILTLVACAIPLRRATRLDPVQALRHE